jgi:hypothetical protein
MKKVLFIVIPVFLFSGRIFALDIALSGGAGNIAFGNERLSSLGQAGLGFTPSLYPFGRVLINGDLPRFIGFNAGFERDAILRNRVFANIAFRLNFINLEIGPFAGIFNSKEKPIKPGISALLDLKFPGIIFFSVRGASTLGTALRDPGDYVQESGSLALGFWVPHVECVLSINARDFARQTDGDVLIRDEQIRYQFTGNIFARFVPYRVRLDLGYQKLKRSYTTAGKTQGDELDSLFIGAEVVFTAGPAFRFLLGGEMPVYSWGKSPLKGPDSRSPLFQAHGGFIWTLPKKP